jgi:hypothetical protein
VKDFKLTSSNMEYITQELRKLDLSQAKRLVISDWKPNRSISANNQQHRWYGEIAKYKGDTVALDIKNFCKDSIGLPILLNSDKHGDKMEFLLDKLDYYKHSYESKMKLIQCLEVTSLFNTPEAKEYMDNMIFYWNENGVQIKFKDR